MAAASVRELFDLGGKTAIVTGGARNLGYDMALALAEMGADVAVTSRKVEDAEAAGSEFPSEYESLRVGSTIRHPKFGVGKVVGLGDAVGAAVAGVVA